MLPGTSSCQGQITATFTWNNGGDQNKTPPPGVVVKESCTASWSGESGACDNGLGHPVVSGPTSGSASGDRYRFIANPGPSFSVTCNPSSNASVSISWMIGGCSTVSYCASALPVDISLTGGAVVGGVQSYLVGQCCKAMLNTGLLAPEMTASSPSWSISEGDPFGAWVASLNSASVSPVAPMVGTTAITCHFRTPSKEPVISVSGRLIVPPGSLPSGYVMFTVSRQVSTAAPMSVFIGQTFDDAPSAGRIPGWPSPGVAIRLIAADLYSLVFGGQIYPALDWGAGIEWAAATRSPSEYTGTDAGWNCIQTVIPGRWLTLQEPGKPLEAEKVSVNGQLLLDTSLPYSPKPVVAGGISTYPADGVGMMVCDAPSQGMPSTTRSLTVDEHFSMYLMYRPPSPGPDHPSQFTPVRRHDWYWTGAATRPPQEMALASPAGAMNGDTTFPPHPVWPGRATTPFEWVPDFK